MLRFLFPRLTPAPGHGDALFAAVTDRARERHWYVGGGIPDTLDGRFRALVTIAALVIVRLEQLGEDGDAASVAMTERFIDVMESEHREMGLGDPRLGRTVRQLVASLGRRAELWRSAIAGEDWADAARRSAYKGDAAPGAIAHTAQALRALWSELERADLEALVEGRIS